MRSAPAWSRRAPCWLPAGAGAGRARRRARRCPISRPGGSAMPSVRDDDDRPSSTSMVIAPAFSGDLPAAHRAQPSLGATSTPSSARASDRRRSADRGIDFVAQEAVTLSTMPVWHDGRFEPRPFILRLYLAARRRRLGGDAGRLRPHRRRHRRARRQPAAGRAHRRRLGAVGQAGAPRPRCCRRRTGSRSSAPPACCRAAPPTTCSGSAATSSAPRRRCGWCGRWSTASTEAGEAAARRQRRHQRHCCEPGSAVPEDMPEVRPALVAAAALHAARARRLAAAAGRGAARSAASVIRDRFSPDAWRALNDLVATDRCAAAGTARPRAPCSSASTARCASSRRSPGWRRRT